MRVRGEGDRVRVGTGEEIDSFSVKTIVAALMGPPLPLNSFLLSLEGKGRGDPGTRVDYHGSEILERVFLEKDSVIIPPHPYIHLFSLPYTIDR